MVTSAFGVDHTFSKARNRAGVTPSLMGQNSMTHRGGEGYFNPTDEQVAASQARRSQQKAEGQRYRSDVKPKIRTGGGKKIPWAVHRAAMGRNTPRQLAVEAGVATAAVGGLAAYNHRDKIKKWDRKDTDTAVGGALGATAGGVGTKGALSVAGTGGKITLKNRRAARGESAYERKVWADHGKTYQTKYLNGKPADPKAYRKYPKELPDWKLQRAIAYKNTPKVARGIMAAGAVTGAALGARSARRHAQ